MPHLLVALSSHGYGHAAQTAPVVNALRRIRREIQLTLRTDLPTHFLRTRFEGEFEVMPGIGDFGLVMQSALAVDKERSAKRYADLHAHWEGQVAAETQRLKKLRPDLVISNISYLALAAAREAPMPSVALCSFTWSLIYEHYFADAPGSGEVLRQMRRAYAGATEVLALEPGMPLDLPQSKPVAAIARQGKAIRNELRAHLGVPQTQRVVVVSLGGIRHDFDLTAWPSMDGIHWIVPKAWLPKRADMTVQEDLPFHFTELLASSDAFVTKPGYGAFTEAACNGIPVLYVPRGDWPEEPFLLDWMHKRRHPILAVPTQTLLDGSFREPLNTLWHMPATTALVSDGVDTVIASLRKYL